LRERIEGVIDTILEVQDEVLKNYNG